MKFQTPVNENYAATVVSIKSLNPLENCDNVVGSVFFGFQGIVDKTTQIGDLGIVFPAETQLSEEYTRMNNLHRHGDKNADPGVTGYLEDSRRVKAMKFRGHRSDCLWMPISSLAYTGIKINDLQEGDTFDVINGHEICRKYVINRNSSNKTTVAKKPKFRRVDEALFPLHIDTANYWRNKDNIPENAPITVTQKIHGTSIRIANTVVKRRLNWYEHLLKKFGVPIAETEYDHVYGSRRVTKDANDPTQNHFYDSDLWSQEGKKLDHIVPKGFVFYGELVGWASNDSPIQNGYTYQVPQGTAELYIYRIAHVNPDGRVTDLTWDQVKTMCNEFGIKHIPELWRGLHKDFNADEWIDIRYQDAGFAQALPLDKGKDIVDEGVCVRMEGLTPYVLKAKSRLFLERETKMLDAEVVDIESEDA